MKIILFMLILVLEGVEFIVVNGWEWVEYFKLILDFYFFFSFYFDEVFDVVVKEVIVV